MSNEAKTPDNENERLAFESLVIGHTRLVETLARVTSLIRNPCGTSMVLLFGATAVGKTTLEQRLLRRHNDLYANLIAEDRSVIPSCYVEVPAPDNGKLNWRDLNIRALDALNEPYLDKKATGSDSRYNGINGADIRRSLEKALKNRKTLLLIYDEAQHFTKVTGAKSSQQQQDYIKSMASLSGTFIVLAGTYELLQLLPRSGQLARRMLPVHLARYRADNPDDWRTFREVILTFEQALPLSDKPQLLDHAESLFRGSLGCVGLLKCWLNRSLALVIESKSKRMTLEHLRATMLPKPALDRIEQEIREGEKLAADYEEPADAFRKIMRTAEPTAKTDAGAEAVATPKRAVGQRKPHRDKVGV